MMQQHTKTIESLLEHDGFLLKDNLLPPEVFVHHRNAVLAAWTEGKNWNTRIKAANDVKVLSRQGNKETCKILSLIRRQKSVGSAAFQYIYHSIHQNNDHGNLIAPILKDVKLAWQKELGVIASDYSGESFSITAYTEGCFLDPHTDSSDDTIKYKVTILLYFGSDNENEEENACSLYFKYRGRTNVITPRSNRGVLFVPTPETHHWIPEVAPGASIRFALSGWLL